MLTEVFNKNKEAYLSLCRNQWDMDENSMKYIENRLSDEWKPVLEYDELLAKGDFIDQRIRIPMDMANPDTQQYFEAGDSAYKTFKSRFNAILMVLREKYNCKVSYGDFINNKVVFKKNTTKIKKVFETIYLAEKEDNYYYYRSDFNHSSSYIEGLSEEDLKKQVAADIVKAFEVIGATKKSAVKLEFVISFNPMDWFGASTHETWSSCFDIDKDFHNKMVNSSESSYQYCLGLPFLCGDKNRCLMYITDGEKKNYLGIEADRIRSRTWCILDRDLMFTLVKWYPNKVVDLGGAKGILKSDRIKTSVEFHEGLYDYDVLSTCKGAFVGVYSDMGTVKSVNNGNGLRLVGSDVGCQQIYAAHNTKRKLDISEGEFRSVNGENVKEYIPRWIKAGVHLDMAFKSRKCSCCGKDSIGSEIDDDKDSKFRYKFLCEECKKDISFICDACNNTYMNDKKETITLIDGSTTEVCKYCYENMHPCDCCGKYDMDNDFVNTEDNKRICKSCFETSNYMKCDICGNVSKNIYGYFSLNTNSNVTACGKHNDITDNVIFKKAFGLEEKLIRKRVRKLYE